LYSSLNIVRTIKSRKVRWVRHVAWMEKRGMHTVLVGKPEGKRSVGRRRHKTKLNSVALVRERSMPTERPPLVGEVVPTFCGQRVSRGQRNVFPRSLISVF
jgi:hypothetical protein